jgi:UDP-N-acetylglucosamine:LPS N-acetylglucosamine transferase
MTLRASAGRPLDRGARVLILCADIGEGHVTVARALAARLHEQDGVEAVKLRTDLGVLGERFGGFMDRGFHLHLGGTGGRLAQLSYELGYRVFFERALPRAAAHLALAVLGGRGLRHTIAAFRADVVVAEYPVLSAALGQLRALGRLQVPVCSSISDPAGLWYWAHPGIDLHLLSWPESLAEAEAIAGRGRAAVIRPLIDERFSRLPSAQAARAALELPLEPPVVLVSGGGWGVGDLGGAARSARSAVPDSLVICLCGRNETVRRQLTAEHAGDPRVRVLGFTEQMPELLAAADALVHTTGGTTALEARIAGCRLVSYDTSLAHVRAHARALERLGIAPWAPDAARLAAILPAVLAQAAPPPLRIDALPNAASLVLKLARDGGVAGCIPANQRAASVRACAAGSGT